MPTMFDSTTPTRISGGPNGIGIYGTGLYTYPRSQIQRQFPGARVLSIDALGTNPAGCGILDVERWDAKPTRIPGWVDERLEAHQHGVLCRIYMQRSSWAECRDYAAELPAAKRATILWWVADWTGAPHMLAGADAVQWASGAMLGKPWDASVTDARFLAG